MIDTVLTKIFGSKHSRDIKKMLPVVAEINALEPQMQALSDEALGRKTAEFRAEIEAGKTTDDLLAPAFAAVREASRRTLGMRHFDVQRIGAATLHQGRIAAM